MAKKQDTKFEEKSLATTGTTEMASYDYGDDAVAPGQVAPGYENQTSQDTSIPFISLLQPISPVVVQQSVEGAVAGMWMNTVSKQLFKGSEGIYFVPSTTRHEYLQFKPRKIGGGFVTRYDITDPIVEAAKKASKKFGEYYVDNLEDKRTGEDGDELTETFTVIGVLCSDEGEVITPAIIPFKGTMIKCYKNWMQQIRAFQHVTPDGRKQIPPIYSHLARFTTKLEQKNGNNFFVPVFTPALGTIRDSLIGPSDDRFMAAKGVHMMVNAGSAAVNYDKATPDDGLPKDADGKPLF